MSGVKAAARLAGTAATTRCRYSRAAAAVVTGGTKLGMMMARPYCCAVWGTTDCRPAPSRTCRCQSSGRVMTSVSGAAPAAAATARHCRRPAAGQRRCLTAAFSGEGMRGGAGVDSRTDLPACC